MNKWTVNEGNKRRWPVLSRRRLPVAIAPPAEPVVESPHIEITERGHGCPLQRRGSSKHESVGSAGGK